MALFIVIPMIRIIVEFGPKRQIYECVPGIDPEPPLIARPLGPVFSDRKLQFLCH